MSAKKKSSKDYFGLPRFVSIILALIPVTAFLLGVITRFKEKKFVAGLLRLLLGWNLIWLLDFILILFKGHIWRLLNV